MPNQDYPGKAYNRIANVLARKGRYGDSMLMHVTPGEVDYLNRAGVVTINPDTGLPEAFLATLLALLAQGATAGGAALASVPVVGSALGAIPTALGSGLGAAAHGLAAVPGMSLGSGLLPEAAQGILAGGAETAVVAPVVPGPEALVTESAKIPTTGGPDTFGEQWKSIMNPEGNPNITGPPKVGAQTPTTGGGEFMQEDWARIMNPEGNPNITGPPKLSDLPTRGETVPSVTPTDAPLTPEDGGWSDAQKLMGAYALSSVGERLFADDDNIDYGEGYPGDPSWEGREYRTPSGGGSSEKYYYMNRGGLVPPRPSADRGFYGAYDPYRGKRTR